MQEVFAQASAAGQASQTREANRKPDREGGDGLRGEDDRRAVRGPARRSRPRSGTRSGRRTWNWRRTPRPGRNWSGPWHCGRRPSARTTRTPSRASTTWRPLLDEGGLRGGRAAAPAGPGRAGEGPRPGPPGHPSERQQPGRRCTRRRGTTRPPSRCTGGPWPGGRRPSARTTRTPSRASTTWPPALRAKGDYAAAEPLLRRALAGREKALGPDHPDTLASVNNLAALLPGEGGPRGRRAALPAGPGRAGEGPRPGPPGHPHERQQPGRRCYEAKGDYAAAEPLYRRALAGREKALGPDHPDTLTSVNNLAVLLQAKGDYAAAEPLYRRALAGREKALGPDHPDTLRSVDNLAELYFDDERYADAVPLLERAARGYAKRPELAAAVPVIRSDLGLSLLGAGKPADAEPHLLAGYDGLAKQKTPQPAGTATGCGR